MQFKKDIFLKLKKSEKSLHINIVSSYVCLALYSSSKDSGKSLVDEKFWKEDFTLVAFTKQSRIHLKSLGIGRKHGGL